jgi:hypothetical protein
VGRGVERDTPRAGKVDYFNLIGYLPLAALNASAASEDGSAQFVLKLGPNNELRAETAPPERPALGYRILGSNGKEIVPNRTRAISTTGASLRAEGAMPRVSVDNELLVVEGRSRAIEVSWPLQGRLEDSTRFFFGIDQGAKDIAEIALELELADGSRVRRAVVANQAVQLDAGQGQVRHITARIAPAASSFRLKLREMALFTPGPRTYGQVYSTPFPKRSGEAPKPVVSATTAAIIDASRGASPAWRLIHRPLSPSASPRRSIRRSDGCVDYGSSTGCRRARWTGHPAR